MANLRDKLISGYAVHYTRGNGTRGPRALAVAARAHLDACYADIVGHLHVGSHVLDVGCGTGYLLAWLAAREGLLVTGVDSSESQVAVAAKELPGVHVECADGLSFLRRHPSRFAAVFCLDVLEHIPDDELLDWLQAVRSALAPGGYFVCKVPNAANLTASQLRYIDLTHVRSFTASSLRQLIEAAAFTDYKVVPVRTGHFAGSLRETIEAAAHKMIFRLCGEGTENVFTRTMIGIGRKCMDEA